MDDLKKADTPEKIDELIRHTKFNNMYTRDSTTESLQAHFYYSLLLKRCTLLLKRHEATDTCNEAEAVYSHLDFVRELVPIWQRGAVQHIMARAKMIMRLYSSAMADWEKTAY